jgi:hypothetical protein
MNKVLVALVLISLMGLFIIGCKATIPGTPAPAGNQATGNEPATTGEQTGNNAGQAATDNSITGQINDIDSLKTELNDPEIQNTDSLINEVNW